MKFPGCNWGHLTPISGVMGPTYIWYGPILYGWLRNPNPKNDDSNIDEIKMRVHSCIVQGSHILT